jgi:hypothetical protein
MSVPTIISSEQRDGFRVDKFQTRFGRETFFVLSQEDEERANSSFQAETLEDALQWIERHPQGVTR